MHVFFRIWVILLLIFSACFSTEIITVFEEENFGNPELSEFLYSLNVDCENGKIIQEVFDENTDPVKGARSYLKYHQYDSPLISSGITNSGGRVVHNLPGDPEMMTGLFVIVSEKGGFMKKEIHFDLKPCLEEESGISPPDVDPPESIPDLPPDDGVEPDGEEIPEDEVPKDEENLPGIPKQNESSKENESGQDIEPDGNKSATDGAEGEVCPLPFFIIFLCIATREMI